MTAGPADGQPGAAGRRDRPDRHAALLALVPWERAPAGGSAQAGRVQRALLPEMRQYRHEDQRHRGREDRERQPYPDSWQCPGPAARRRRWRRRWRWRWGGAARRQQLSGSRPRHWRRCVAGSRPGVCRDGLGWPRRQRRSGLRCHARRRSGQRYGSARAVGRHTERFPQRRCEVRAGFVPLVGGLGHHRGQHLVGGARQIRAPSRERRRRGIQVGGHHGHDFVAAERRRPGQQLVRHAAQRVLISARAGVLAVDLLWRQVVHGAHQEPWLGQRRRRDRGLGYAEVRQVHVFCPGVHQDVLRLDVPVYQARRVRRVQRGGHLGDVLHGPFRH